MHRILFLPLFVLLTIAFLNGCASGLTDNNPVSAANSKAIETAETKSQEAKAKETAESELKIKKIVKDIPERRLDKETMSLLLEAEFSLYRQDIDTAMSIYEQLTANTLDPGVAKRSAEIALANNDPFKALDAALLYFELAPDDSSAIELASRALARNAEVEGAWELINQHPDKTYELRMMTAEAVRLARQMENNYQIEWLLKQVIAKYGGKPNDHEVQLAMGLIYEILGNYDKASVLAEQVSLSQPHNILALRLRANSLLRSNRPDAASIILSDWIRTHKDDSETRITLVQMLASFDPQAALPVMEELCEEYPWAGQLWMGTAQLHLSSGTPENATPYFQHLTQFGLYRNVSFFNLGQINHQLGDLESASKFYGLVENANSNNKSANAEDENLIFEAALREARIEYIIGKNGSILFTKLRELYPDQYVGLIHEEATVLLKDDLFQPAIAILTAGLDHTHENEALLYTRSIAYERSGNIDAAISDLETILAMDDTNAMAMNALGYTLANRTNRYFEAYDLIDRALSIDPEDPAIIDSMGWVLFHLGRYEEALEHLQQAHSSMLDEEVISHLAEVLTKLDRLEEAKAVLNQGLIDLPNSRLIPKTKTKLGLDS